jgi:small subunit ribosomal protein S10e
LFDIDGALVAAKDFNLAKHPEIDVPNLEVIKSMQSLTSKGFVKTQFSWQFYYYTLTDEGIDYLRECKSSGEQVLGSEH